MRSEARRAVAGACTAFALVALVPAAASAATYTVWSCRGPDGAPLATAAWRPGDERGATTNSCATGGALRAVLLPSDNASGLVRGFAFQLPAGASIAGYRADLAATTAESDEAGAYQAGLALDAPLGVLSFDAGCTVAGCAFGTPATPLAPANRVTATGLDSHALTVGVRCGAIFGCKGQAGETSLAELRLFRSQVDIRDDALPVVGPGTVATDPGTGRAIVTALTSDAGGGVAATALEVDGVEVERAPSTECREPYTVAAPCPGAVLARFTTDVAGLAAGAHTVAIRALDAAGNIITGAALPLGAAAAAVPAPVAAQPVTISVDHARIDLTSRGAIVSGSVRGPGGAPVAGAVVLVRHRAFGVHRSALRTEPSLTTDAAGHFSMPAGSASRILRLDVDDPRYRAAQPVEADLMGRLRVTAAASDRSLQNGSALTLRATIAGAGTGAANDKAVLVQVFAGGRWSTIDALNADARGRVAWHYRFRGTTRPAIYRFRVRVEHAGDVWPWAATDSPEVRVSVAP